MTRITVVDPAHFLADFPSDGERFATLKEIGFTFPTWKKIVLGTKKGTGATIFKRDHRKNGRKVSAEARDILEMLVLGGGEREVELVKVRLYDLCLTRASLHEILGRAIELGLKPCLAEVGPQLWQQHAHQLSDCRLLIAMEAIIGPDDLPQIFTIECDECGKILDADYALPISKWNLDDEFIFCK